MARSLPPVSRWLAKGLSRLAGGHRRGTHSLLGLLAIMVLAELSQRASVPVGDALQRSGTSPRRTRQAVRLPVLRCPAGGAQVRGSGGRRRGGVVARQAWPLAACCPRC
ncbi:hypothetical protein QJS66_11125 [Kocuria rhizophila]|nr:hypothetical protein QJS66_11125 [Kocuria rhizophila]